MAARFGWYELRTLDPVAARAFYAGVLGLEVAGDELVRSGAPVATVMALPPPARARGAPAHWLGYVDVDDVEATAARIAAAGGQALGPMRQVDGGARVILRDRFGAVLGLRGDRARTSDHLVGWHQLNVVEREPAWAAYTAMFGWDARAVVELSADFGPVQQFAWDPSGEVVGGVVASARQAHVHTHWAMFMAVAELASALDAVGSGGGRVAYGPTSTPSGAQIAYCEDPQGAAFGLIAPA